jgi:nucleotide-binding universal stress UspA family protein
MVILCGVENSVPARQAARAAAALAKRAKEGIRLLHVQDTLLLNIAIEPDGTAAIPIASQDLLDAERAFTESALEPLREQLAREFGVSVGLEFSLGFAENELVRRARELDASLIVVGAVGRRSGSMWRLGSVPDRLSQIAPVPVTVVRDAESLARWALENRPLRVAVALDADSSSARAAEAAAELARLGPCEIVQIHVYDPRREAQRLGLGRADDADTLLAIERILARELQERAGRAVQEQARFVALPAHGHVAEALAKFAERERADLVVVGTRGRGALELRFLGSVAYGLLGISTANVLLARQREVVPAAHAPRAPTSIRRVLAATDLSETGNRAVDYALALMPPGGQLTLLHVLQRPLSVDMVPIPDPVASSREEQRMDRSLARAELHKLVEDPGQGIEVEVEAVESHDVTQAILQAAERHDADLVVLGRHGRTGLVAALMGSSVRGVAQRCPRPVLIVPDARESA